jgi:hypothetical protein
MFQFVDTRTAFDQWLSKLLSAKLRHDCGVRRDAGEWGSASDEDIARVVENSVHEHGRKQGQPRFELDYGSADSNAIIPIAMRAREHHTRRNNDLDHQVPPLAAINCLNNGFQGRLHDWISTAITTASNSGCGNGGPGYPWFERSGGSWSALPSRPTRGPYIEIIKLRYKSSLCYDVLVFNEADEQVTWCNDHGTPHISVSQPITPGTVLCIRDEIEHRTYRPGHLGLRMYVIRAPNLHSPFGGHITIPETVSEKLFKPDYSKWPCVRFAEGYCSYGDSCWFLHSSS